MPQLITLGALMLALIGLYSGRGRPVYWFFGAAAGLYGLGVLTLPEALSGLVNEGVVTLALLMVIAHRIQASGLLNRPLDTLLNRTSHHSGGFLLVLAPVALISAFLNNTPIVAVLLHPIREWAIRRGDAPSRYLLPLSYAAIIGGTLTLVGTSTNLVVFGLLTDLAPGHQLNVFSPVWVGLPLLLVFLLYYGMAKRWLPKRIPVNASPERVTEFQIHAQIDASIEGLSVAEAGLRHLKQGYLYRLQRANEWQQVGADTRLKADDRLVFLGSPGLIQELSLVPGINVIRQGQSTGEPTHLLEAIVPVGSALIGQTARAIGFRKRYGAVIVSVAHQTDQHFGKLGEYNIQAGDLLLLETPSSQTFPPSADLTVLNRHQSAHSTADQRRGYFMLLLFPIMVVGGTLMGMPLLKVTVLYLALSFLLRVAQPADFMRGIDVQLFGILIGALALATAVEKTQLDVWLLSPFMGLIESAALGVLVIFALCWVMTELITNHSAAALMLPFALSIGQVAGLSVEQVAITVMMAASTSFITPFGYQTNLMVLSAGNYRPLDYLKFGTPLVIFSATLTTLIVPRLPVIFY
ncbi:SLC13 family permease [Saccharospirillum mangrovi]|uniref:SLC13 family permease n=1 Tax=Saccharospirillum mangrovi TaxID=2161747 RepID=UPI0013B43836|nr:SLC13 family permease [Saccharospirillum mangrovi]